MQFDFFSSKKLLITALLLGVVLIGFYILFYAVSILKHTEKKNENNAYALLKDAREYEKTALLQASEYATSALQGAKKESDDTVAIQAYIEQGKIKCLQGNNTEGYQLFSKALYYSDSVKYFRGKAESLQRIGEVYYNWGDYNLSLQYFSKVRLLAKQHNFNELHAEALNYTGKYYHTIGDFNKSVAFYNKALEIDKNIHSDQTTFYLLGLGKTYLNDCNIHMALKCYLDANKESLFLNDKMAKADAYNHLGSIYLALNQEEKSLEYHRKAIELRSELKNSEGLAKSFNNIGETFFYMNNIDSALYYFQNSYAKCIETGYKKGMIKALTNLGKANFKILQNEKAEAFLLCSLDSSQIRSYNNGILEASLALGNLYAYKKEYKKAIKYYEESLRCEKKANIHDFSIEIHHGLFKCYNELEDYKTAIKYQIKLADAERYALQAENNSQLSELRVSFDLEKKEKENEVLRKDNELKAMAIQRSSAINYLFVAIITGMLLISLLVYSRFAQKRKAHRELQMLNNKLETALDEKDKLFSIIAHELRNPLYWFQNLAEVLSKNFETMPKSKVQKSLEVLDDSAKNAFHLMDNLLQWSRSKLNRITPKKALLNLHPVVDEVVVMYKTVILHKDIFLKNEIQAKQKVFADADMLNCILRNLISNAIKYTPAGGNISIESEIQGEECMITVFNSDSNIPHSLLNVLFDNDEIVSTLGQMQEKGSGLGLKLCKEYVELNEGRIWVTSESNTGTKFVFTLPVTS